MQRPLPHPPFHSPTTFHDDLPSNRAGYGAALTRGQQSDAKQLGCHGIAQQRAEELISVLESSHVVVAPLVEDGSGDDEDGRVHEPGDTEGQGRVDGGVLEGLPNARLVFFHVPREHERRVEEEIVRHDSGPYDSHGYIQCPAVFEDLCRGKEAQ